MELKAPYFLGELVVGCSAVGGSGFFDSLRSFRMTLQNPGVRWMICGDRVRDRGELGIQHGEYAG